MELSDFQQLVNYCHSLGENLLTTQDGEFYPFAVTINNSDELIGYAWYDGDEFPESQLLLDKLRSSLNQEISDGLIRAYGLAFDAFVRKDENSEKIDAICIECLSVEDRTTYYFPYKLVDKVVKFEEAWSERK